MVYSTDRSKAGVPVLVLLFVVLWFILRADLFYGLPCVILFLCFSALLALQLPRLLGEERTNLSAFRTFVRFMLVWICRFPLPLGAWEGLRFVIVALPGLFSYLLFLTRMTKKSRDSLKRNTKNTRHTLVIPAQYPIRRHIQVYAKQSRLCSEICKTPGWAVRLMKSSPLQIERIWRSSLMR